MPSLPNLLSLACLALGFAALGAVLGGDWASGAGLLGLGLLADGFAGMAAAKLRRSTPLGAELDNLAALICFGIAAPVVAWSAQLGSMGAWGQAVAGAFAVASAIRLGREDVNRPDRPVYRGLPVHTAGLGLVLAAQLGAGPWACTAVAASAAFLMFSPLRYPRFPRAMHLAAPLGVALALSALGLRQATWLLAAVLGAYALAGPLFAGAAQPALRQARRP